MLGDQKMKYKTLALCAMAFVMTEPAAAQNAREMAQACLQTKMHLVQAEESFAHIVQQEIKDEDVLVDLGYAAYYMSPRESVSVYSKQVSHLKQMAELLGCNGQKMASVTLQY
jgi:thymidine phosphorylase